MSKLPVFYNKTLKLNNVCIREIVDEDIENLDTVVIQMDNYLRSKGAIPVGPIIQYMQSLYNTKKILQIQYDKYIVEIPGNKIKNPHNEFSTQLQLTDVKKGLEFKIGVELSRKV